jgi:penicillin amidase|tara:strand:+ start:517 stop:2916 length:2400 start_codon:yes stop_codon:yes gene_type:complete
MNKSIKYILFIITALLVLLIGLRTYIYPPLPSYEGKISLKGLGDTVNVYTDDFGVPHVFAKNDLDLFLTAGYIAARERLFQMSMVAYAVRGEIASALGDEHLSSDIYLRTWRIPTVAKQLAENMYPEERRILEAFCRGINAQIDEAMNDLPVEFKILRIKPPYWKPSDVTGYARMMAHEMQSSWKPEIVYGAIAEYFGREKLNEIYPGHLPGEPTISKGLKPAFDTILSQEFKIRDLLGFRSPHIGSNSWVLSGKKTASGKPILVNDPHLEFTQPARWYEMHLKGGKYNSCGVCIAGIPVPVIGNNETCAWGFTNSMVDDVDFFIEKIHPDDPNQYFHGKEWKNIQLVNETIPLKSGKDTTVVIRMTHHGPIISDIHPLLQNGDISISMSWTGHRITKEMNAFMKLNTMKNWDDFSKAVKNFGVPGQNIIYADTAGNIGWRPAVYVPIRNEGHSLIPRPGHNPKYDWNGYIPFEEMPFILNPESGYIATANNKTIGDEFPYYISGLWADPSRANRIIELIEPLQYATVDNMKSIQLDMVSPFAREICTLLLQFNFSFDDDKITNIINDLKEWDGEESADSKNALFFHSIIKTLAYNIYGDELSLLGDNYLEAFLGLKYLYTRNLRVLLRTGQSSWFDNITTTKNEESMEDIIKLSIIEGINAVFEKYGDKKENRVWGKAHSLTHPHLLGKVSMLNKIFSLNVGPFFSGGSDKTVRAGGFSYLEPFMQTAGASMRRIVDLNNLDKINFILPTGQSGHPHSPHYRDQAESYNKGKYKTTCFNEEIIKKDKGFRKLTITPRK